MRKSFLILLLFAFTAILSAQTYQELAERAADYVEQKDYAAAEQALKAAMRKEPANPNNTMLLVNLGTVQRNLGKYDDALTSYNVAIGKYPDIAYLLHSRAALLCEMNKLNDALKDYTAIIQSYPNDIEALYRRGLIYMSNKLPAAAEEDFKKISELEPDNLLGKAALARLMKRQGEWEKAEELYTDLIYKNKMNSDLYFNRAECYLQMKKLARMQEDLMKASEYGYNEYPLFILRGQLRLAQYDKRMAKEDFLKAQEMGADPKVIEDLLRLCK